MELLISKICVSNDNNSSWDLFTKNGISPQEESNFRSASWKSFKNLQNAIVESWEDCDFLIWLRHVSNRQLSYLADIFEKSNRLPAVFKISDLSEAKLVEIGLSDKQIRCVARKVKTNSVLVYCRELRPFLKILDSSSSDKVDRCTICLSHPASIRLIPCMHNAVCKYCVSNVQTNRITKCPLCRARIESTKKKEKATWIDFIIQIKIAIVFFKNTDNSHKQKPKNHNVSLESGENLVKNGLNWPVNQKSLGLGNRTLFSLTKIKVQLK